MRANPKDHRYFVWRQTIESIPSTSPPSVRLLSQGAWGPSGLPSSWVLEVRRSLLRFRPWYFGFLITFISGLTWTQSSQASQVFCPHLTDEKLSPNIRDLAPQSWWWADLGLCSRLPVPEIWCFRSTRSPLARMLCIWICVICLRIKEKISLPVSYLV